MVHVIDSAAKTVEGADVPDSMERDIEARDAACDQPWSLRDLLSVPFRVEAGTVEVSAGRWLRRAAYPELPGCTAEAATIEEALKLLERRRIEIVVAMLRAGEHPPVPRPPLRDCDPQGVAEALDVAGLVAGLLDRTSLTNT